jgi:hypothetical protein
MEFAVFALESLLMKVLYQALEKLAGNLKVVI